MAATVVLNDLYLNGTTVVAYSGSGSPWLNETTTPYEIANNDVAGPRFVLTTGETTAITSGQPPFSLLPQPVAFQTPGQRTVQIPIQMRATDQQYLPTLLTTLRTRCNQLMSEIDGGGLVVTYEGKSVRLGVLSSTFQETDRFWNDEERLGVLRGVLTLQCTVGVRASAQTLIASQSLTNANRVAYATLVGDWVNSLGQPVDIALSGGDIGTSGVKVVYAATSPISNTSGSLSESLATSSTSGATATGTVTSNLDNLRRCRFLCAITSPSSNLQVRVVVRLNTTGGAAIYTGAWLSPGTSTTIVDLGFVVLSNELLRSSGGTDVLAQLQYRSSNGSATSGTLTRLHAVQYLTWAKITTGTTTTNDTMALANYIRSGWPGADLATVISSGGATREISAVQGALPRAFSGDGLWLAWTNGGVYDSADSITVAATYYQIFETIGGA